MNDKYVSARSEPAYYDARAAMLLGICTMIFLVFYRFFYPFVPLFALAGLIVSIKAISVGRQRPSPLSMKMAVIGLVCSVVATIVVGLFVFFNFYPEVRGVHKREACLANCKQIGLAMSLYADDYDDKLPPAHHWQAALRDDLKATKHTKSNVMPYRCASSIDMQFSYGMNNAMNSLSRQSVNSPTTTAFAFDCSLHMQSASGGREAVEFRHKQLGCANMANFVFVDGHAVTVSATKTDEPNVIAIDQVRWSP